MKTHVLSAVLVIWLFHVLPWEMQILRPCCLVGELWVVKHVALGDVNTEALLPLALRGLLK